MGGQKQSGPTLKPSILLSSNLDQNDDNDDRLERDDERDKKIPVINNPRKKTNSKCGGPNRNNLTVIKRSNKLVRAQNLPTVMNVNPRSIYNKVEEFHTFVEEEEIDCVFMSESWERPYQPLDEIINLPNHMVISNPHQRKGVGGGPALIINTQKYDVKNITQSLIQIPWGVEAIWGLISPKNITNDSTIKKIAVCSLYCKPDSRKKSLLLDHISQAFNILSAKYGKGLHFIIAGDTNDLKLDNILNLSHETKMGAPVTTS